ncbi:hypothetical protein CCH79_00014055 [Gambusia affinis]|uniref:Gla-rich protein n=1 Tax=Gambusia affinis TaxID=33528 RepID=A0A315W3G0_GAMAF|nr:hypothetical protein CCH79_00014055 [Gambusia affinis]
MKKELVVFLLCLVLLATETVANPIIGEKFAKQLLRSKRQDRPVKAGHPDEPMRNKPQRTEMFPSDQTKSRNHERRPRTMENPEREHLLRMQTLDQRAQETNMEYWLNPHCPPRCDRNYGHPV